MEAITNTEDVIDSRDVIARIAELVERTATDTDNPLDDDERSELEALTALAEEASPYAADWEYGETLIRDSHFVEWTQQFAEDVGAIDSESRWPATCIDWDQAARELQMDYTSVTFGGVTYWVR